MTEQLAFIQNYKRMVAAMLAAFPEDEAMARAVGGDYARVGLLEHCALLHAGLFHNARVLDVGCGSGRLAVRLAAYPQLSYHGTDIVEALLDYARRKVDRADFRFTQTADHTLPATDSSVDFVTFFSVFTHILHEEAFVYLQEALRVLRPGGKVVFSFLDPMVAHNWPIFAAGAEWVRSRSMAGHLNVFSHPEQLKKWLEYLPAELERHVPGDEPYLTVPEAMATPEVPANTYAFGQSLMVLRKVGPSEAPAQISGSVDNSATPLLLGGWAKVADNPELRLRVEVTQRGRIIGVGKTGANRVDVGKAAFLLNLQEELDDDAVLAGAVTVRAGHGGHSVTLPWFKGLEDKLRPRRLRRLVAQLSPAERSAFLAEFGLDAPFSRKG